MGEKLPRKKMPEFKIADKKIRELKTVSAVTKVLSENPELAEEIAEIFKKVAKEKDRELAEKVTSFLIEKVPEVSAADIKAAFGLWYILLTPPEPRTSLHYLPNRK
jgi:hypothetical protein